MSASSVYEGIRDNLTAASVMGACTVSTNYSVLDTTSGCCAVVGWTEGISVPVTMGTDKQEGWTHIVEVFLRSGNDPISVMDNVIKLADKVMASLREDDTLQGNAEMLLEIRANRTPNETLIVDGQGWLPIRFEVDSTYFPE